VRVCEACLCTASVCQDHRRHHLHPRDDLRQGERHWHLLKSSRLLSFFLNLYEGLERRMIDNGKKDFTFRKM
jgi:hypothetical protein